jgi:S1-C subfamily serine protease
VRAPSSRRGVLTRFAALLFAAVAGGAVAVGGTALVLGVGDDDDDEGGVATASVFRTETSPNGFDRDEPLSLAEVYEQTEGGVVQVKTTAVVENPDVFGLPQPEQQSGLGSGFVIDKSGHIVTNFHVVEGADEVEVSFSNGEEMDAAVIGNDPSTDIAVLKVEADSRALTPLRLGDSDALRVGDEVVAIGNPLGFERTMTAGIVSALGRVIEAPNLFAIEGVIQTDAPINSGNSGGPLLNAAGRVVGVNTQIVTAGSSGNIGIGLAVPIDTVKDVAGQLIDHGSVEHAYLGIETQEIEEDIADELGLPVKRGLLISRVLPGTPAERAGLRGGTEEVLVEGTTWIIGGDIIVAADGTELRTWEQLLELIAEKDPGDTMALRIYRDGEPQNVDVQLGRRPASPPG